MNKIKKNLAINGGDPISKEPILIHLPCLEEDDLKNVVDVVKTTFVSGDGPECRQFEKELAEYLGVKHALFVNSATSALELAFRVKDFKPGSEVIVPNFTYTSTALGALYNNLNIKLVDVYPDNGCIDVSKIEKKITKRTKLIVIINTYGNVCDLKEIIRIGKKYSIPVLEDSAESLGSTYFKKQYLFAILVYKMFIYVFNLLTKCALNFMLNIAIFFNNNQKK